MSKPLVIIGSGLAGYMLAKEWRKKNNEDALTVITSADGTFYSKPLLSTALTQAKTAQALAVNSVEEMTSQLSADIHTKAFVTHIDPYSQTVTYTDQTGATQQQNYSNLVLACGAHFIKVPLSGDAVAEIISVNDLEGYANFQQWLTEKKHIAILGAGLVGCEFANDLLNAGYQVSIIDLQAYPLASFVPEPIGTQLAAAFTEKGLQWHLANAAVAVNRRGQGYEVLLGDGTAIACDGVMSAVGLRPDIQLAHSAGIKTNRGVVVDRWLRTSEKRIFALGDCAEVAGQVKMYVAPLLQCARALADILEGDQVPVHYPTMPIVIKTPILPVVASPPPMEIPGEWHYEGEGRDLRAMFFDSEGQLRGFALVGTTVRDRIKLAKELPLVFES